MFEIETHTTVFLFAGIGMTIESDFYATDSGRQHFRCAFTHSRHAIPSFDRNKAPAQAYSTPYSFAVCAVINSRPFDVRIPPHQTLSQVYYNLYTDH